MEANVKWTEILYRLVTVHGQRAFGRAINEPRIKDILDMPERLLGLARDDFTVDERAFILQQGHLTTTSSSELNRPATDKAVSDPFEYRITFGPEGYLRRHWSEWLEILEYRVGGLHDFQDVFVLRPNR